MKLIRLAGIIGAAIAVASCSVMDLFEAGDYKYIPITGKVLDYSDQPVEHIKVTLDWHNGMEPNVVYTDSEGIFTSEMPVTEEMAPVTLSITLEDIDGEENGGLFKTIKTSITFFDNDQTTVPTGILDFRLNPAIPSENTPQS